ncbi:MAG: division/cell wall cluster transcriptional repressor MraZ [Ancalomicrobiaceae bacterium]|nr:division/cell wall cluster transcriptional repressor MraZ [Ancalomicrobiaceae bacterium]
MDRFLGRHAKRIDTKGRVSVPAPFRAVLARDGFEGLFVVRSPVSEAVEAGGNQLIAEIDGLLAHFDRFSPEYHALSTALLGAGDTLALDAEGRIVVPDWLKQATGIAEEVVFVGLGTTFQLWEPERFHRFELQARETAARLMRQGGPVRPTPSTGGTP